MSSSNKVLTVSYGTFSCKLEGFEDPFTTLQKVAEYFRVLAASDRHFGGTPQVPDVDTLQEIAAGTTDSAIAAELSENGVTLRQTEPTQDRDDAAAAKTVFKTRRHAPLDLSDFKVDDAAPSGEDSETAEETGADSDAETDNTVAATLAEIRQNVERAEIQDEPDTADEEADAIDDDAPAAADIPDAAAAIAEIQESITAAVNGQMSESELTEEETSGDVSDDTPFGGASADDAEIISDAVAASLVTDAAIDDDEQADTLPISADVEVAQVAQAEDVAFEDTESEAPETPLVQDAAVSETALESSLSDEDEADLMRQLEASQREEDSFESEADVDPDPAVDADAAEKQQREERVSALLGATDGLQKEEEAIERLLLTTKSQMNRPEHVRRINALDTLKAAVIATTTEKESATGDLSQFSEAEESDDATELAAYRGDLKNVQAEGRETQLRKTAPRPAATPRPVAPQPLILVSAQRIDPPEASDTPDGRRPAANVVGIDGNLALQLAPDSAVTTGFATGGEGEGVPAEIYESSTSFADFANRIGAAGLQDLLEAAAAYTSVVEERPRFSRAQVMSKLAKVATEEDEFSKEAGLRAFGRLLREGKILRVQDGQFAISKSSQFSSGRRFGT